MLRRVTILLMAATLLAGCTVVQDRVDSQQRSPQDDFGALHAADGYALAHVQGSAGALYTFEFTYLEGAPDTWMAGYLLREGHAGTLMPISAPLPARHLGVAGIDLLPRESYETKETVEATSLLGQYEATGESEWLLLVWQNQSAGATGFRFLGPAPSVLEAHDGGSFESALLGQGSSTASAGASAADAAVEERFQVGSAATSLTIIISAAREATFRVDDVQGSRGFEHGVYEQRHVFMTTRGPTEVTTTTVGSYAGRFLLMNLDLGDFPMPRSVWQYGS